MISIFIFVGQFSLYMLTSYIFSVKLNLELRYTLKKKDTVNKMLNWFMGLDVWLQALLGTLFTWGLTAVGAALVFFFKTIERNVFNLSFYHRLLPKTNILQLYSNFISNYVNI
mgnify:CR=1 FL=1